MTHPEFYVDGSVYQRNPSCALGWAALQVADGELVAVAQGGRYDVGGHLTNNQAELLAAQAAIEAVPLGGSCTVYSDSEYVVLGITKWVHAWARRGKLTNEVRPMPNAVLWRELYLLVALRRCTWRHVKGHNGDTWNERADEAARGACQHAYNEAMVHSATHYVVHRPLVAVA